MKSQVTGGFEIQQTPAKKQRQTHQKRRIQKLLLRVTDSLPNLCFAIYWRSTWRSIPLSKYSGSPQCFSGMKRPMVAITTCYMG